MGAPRAGFVQCMQSIAVPAANKQRTGGGHSFGLQECLPVCVSVAWLGLAARLPCGIACVRSVRSIGRVARTRSEAPPLPAQTWAQTSSDPSSTSSINSTCAIWYLPARLLGAQHARPPTRPHCADPLRLFEKAEAPPDRNDSPTAEGLCRTRRASHAATLGSGARRRPPHVTAHLAAAPRGDSGLLWDYRGVRTEGAGANCATWGHAAAVAELGS